MSISSKVLEYTAQIQQLLDKINAEVAVGDFKTPTAEASQSPESSLFSPEYKEMVKGILNLAPGLSEIQLKTLVDVEKTKAAGLLTLEACLHLVASSLGFEIDGTEVKKSLPAVENMAPVKSELQADGIDFNLVDYLKYGTIIKGKGRLERKLWGEYDKILYGAGYKYSQPDQAWLFQPRDAKQEQSQPQKTASTATKAPKVIRISEIGTRKSATIEGEILDDPTYKDFDRKDGTVGSVASFRVSDDSGQARISMWNEKAKYAMNFVKGNKVRLTSLMVKDPYEGTPQLSGGKYTEIMKL